MVKEKTFSKKELNSELSVKIYRYLVEIKHQVFIAVFGYSSTCRQKPSCSQYTIKQMKKNGTIVGLLRGLKRALTCYQH